MQAAATEGCEAKAGLGTLVPGASVGDKVMDALEERTDEDISDTLRPERAIRVQGMLAEIADVHDSTDTTAAQGVLERPTPEPEEEVSPFQGMEAEETTDANLVLSPFEDTFRKIPVPHPQMFEGSVEDTVLSKHLLPAAQAPSAPKLEPETEDLADLEDSLIPNLPPAEDETGPLPDHNDLWIVRHPVLAVALAALATLATVLTVLLWNR